jgi:hypothetical protein
VNIKRKMARELVACCPVCLTFESLEFNGEIMVPTMKFEQKSDGKVYHDCDGREVPCRLFPRFLGEWK